MVHEQNFKDLLSSTCLTSSERRVLDLELKVMRAQILSPMGITFCHWILCFHVVKTLMPILAFSYSFWKTRLSKSKTVLPGNFGFSCLFGSVLQQFYWTSNPKWKADWCVETMNIYTEPHSHALNLSVCRLFNWVFFILHKVGNIGIKRFPKL